MASKADFTEQEWEALEKGVTGAGFMVAISDRSFFDTFKEAGALGKHLGHARQDSSSHLIRELAETRSTGFGITDSPDEIETETTEALRTAMTALRTKAPDEVEPYKSFVIEVAESVGSAAGGGEEAEGQTVQKIRAELDAV
jgi:hypothetical protein